MDSKSPRQDAAHLAALVRAVERRAPVTVLLGFPAVALYGHLEGLTQRRLDIQLPLGTTPPPAGHQVLLQFHDGAERVATFATVALSSTLLQVALSGRLHRRAA